MQHRRDAPPPTPDGQVHEPRQIRDMQKQLAG